MKINNLVVGSALALLGTAVAAGGHWLYRANETDAKARTVFAFFANVQKHIFSFPHVMTQDGKNQSIGLVRTPDGKYTGVVVKQNSRTDITMDWCPMRFDAQDGMTVDAARQPMRMDYQDGVLSIIRQSASGHMSRLRLVNEGVFGLSEIETSTDHQSMLHAQTVLNALACNEALETAQARYEAGRPLNATLDYAVPAAILVVE